MATRMLSLTRTGDKAAESAVECRTRGIRLKSAVFDPHKFNELAAPAEAKANAPWLRKRLGEIKVVDSERSVERPATPEEIETGVYAKNFDDNAR
jgi:hypothetical protein